MTSEFEGACRRLESTIEPCMSDLDEEWCDQFDNCRSCHLRCLEDIKAAHERELESVRRDMDVMARGYDGKLAAVYDMYEDKLDALRDELAANRKYEYGYTVEKAYSALRDGIKSACERDPNVWDQAILVGGLESLGNAYDRAIEHSRKEQYHRGYEDGLKARDVGMWQLEHERARAASRLLKVSLDTGGAVKKLSVALGCEWDPPNVQKSLFDLRARLIYLLSGCNLFETRKIHDLEDEPTLQKTTNFANASTIIELSDNYADLVAERDSILDLLRDAAKEHKDLLDKYLAVPWETMQPMDDEHMNKLGWMRALDRDGEPIRMGDVVRYDEKDVPFVGEPFEVEQITHFRNGSCYVSGGWVSVSAKSVQCTHQETNPDPIEQVIRDLTLGSMAETEAIERLHEIIGS